jgi:hypothetical protein
MGDFIKKIIEILILFDRITSSKLNIAIEYSLNFLNEKSTKLLILIV